MRTRPKPAPEPVTVDLQIPDKLIPVFLGKARYRGAYGGRGSAKTRTFAKMAALRGALLAAAGMKGIILCAREFMNSLADSSFAEIKEAIQSIPWLNALYDIGDKYIRTACKRISFVFAGLRHNLDSIKSKAHIHLCWVDEAEAVSETAWVKLIPTIREHDSELWVTWNPESKRSATHKRFRLKKPRNSKIIEMNYTDNEWFPDVLEQERLNDLENRPEQYEHIWEGAMKTVHEGAYFAPLLLAAKKTGRIGRVAADPLLPIRAYWDLGGSGANADAMAIWIVQFVGREIRVLDYIEGQGQVLAYYVQELRDRGYGKAVCILPHDGVNENNVTGLKYEDHVRQARFTVRVVKNQGKGAASMRIEAVRRLGPRMWFNEATTEAGREALGHYHEKRSEDDRNIGLGPEHDWSSHGSDAFGLMAVDYREPGGAGSGKLDMPNHAAA